jgi:hypothetical protein
MYNDPTRSGMEYVEKRAQKWLSLAKAREAAGQTNKAVRAYANFLIYQPKLTSEEIPKELVEPVKEYLENYMIGPIRLSVMASALTNQNI